MAMTSRVGAFRINGVLLLVLVALLVAVAPASAAQDRTFNLSANAPSEWDGPSQTALNQGYDQDTGGPCGKDSDNYCDITLVNTGIPDPSDAYYQEHQASLTIDVGGFNPPPQDFDLYVYESNAAGDRGAFVDSSGNPAGLDESVTIPKPNGYYLVIVPYFATNGSYHGKATLTETNTPKPALPDVNNPPGVPDTLASNPALGFTSHSEPHIAQSPTNPNILIAGSKMYNKDRAALKEYEFKIGTYVSFDRGRTWSDLGQMNLCPKASDAPPASWPDNTCYPADSPNVGGNGPEDAKDNRGHTDYGEEYITSDIWMQFDDEGNAYAMVLDSPPFADANGWGMSFHKWVTPSPQDVASGKTWSKRVVINNYPQEKGNVGKEANGTTNADNGSNPAEFLDDKNTFAVDNSGRDADGKTGTILACWGQNISAAVKQQTVCEASTDGGKSFPDPPKPVSGEQQLVLGVNALADPSQPDTFYVIWKGYTTAVAGGIVFPTAGEGEEDDLGTGLGTHPAQIYMSKTADGGQTYTPARPIATFDDLASPFPGSNFRTTAIPIAAAGPNGDVYVVYDAYNDAPDAAHDADGKSADTELIKSTDGGVTFSSPQVVNQDRSNADQFQSHVAVNPAGQVSVAYFDRRQDPANHYVDEYLSRSTDGGKTWRDTRLSHDMADPGIHAPVPTSGEFFGDYQGLVADRCQSLAFYQDTHLANSAARDPNFDKGAPRSPFQEVFAYRAEVPGQQSNAACAKPPKSEQGHPFVNPPGTRCRAVRPTSSISRRSLRARRRSFRMSGSASDIACRGRKARGKVKRVQVAIGKKTRTRCRFFRGRGRFTKSRPCSKPVYLRARVRKGRRGTVTWSFTARGAFGSHLYSLRSRATDSAGNVETRKVGPNHRVVRVRG